jgi:AraC family transcriptional regulator
VNGNRPHFAESSCRSEHEGATAALTKSIDFHLGDLHVMEVEFRSNMLLPPHDHANARLGFVLSGSVAETYVDAAILCDANSFSFHPSRTTHTNEVGFHDSRSLIIEFCGERWPSRFPLIGAEVEPFSVPMGRLRGLALDLSHELRARDHASPLLIEGLALDLMSRATRRLQPGAHDTAGPSLLDEATKLIDRQLHRSLSLPGVASALGVSPKRLAGAFIRHGQTTFRRHLHRTRVQHAAGLLQDRTMPLAEIALASGFYDQAHLGRAFRRVIGTTPGQYRSQSGTSRGETS